MLSISANLAILRVKAWIRSSVPLLLIEEGSFSFLLSIRTFPLIHGAQIGNYGSLDGFGDVEDISDVNSIVVASMRRELQIRGRGVCVVTCLSAGAVSCLSRPTLTCQWVIILQSLLDCVSVWLKGRALPFPDWRFILKINALLFLSFITNERLRIVKSMRGSAVPRICYDVYE